ncbi:MAG: hypothetical protein R6U58_02280 [Bacteroidales bacterium]
MNSNDNSFRHDFETLMALFKKLADKMSEGEIPGMNPQFTNQFKMMLSQYEMMKHMMPDDIPEQFREPFRQMMENMIYQLKEEVGEDMVIASEKQEDKDRTIEEIEQMLSRPGLEPGEMDKLLDKLADLKSKKG